MDSACRSNAIWFGSLNTFKEATHSAEVRISSYSGVKNEVFL